MPPIRARFASSRIPKATRPISILSLKGVQLAAPAINKCVSLRKIPVDPMTGRAEWGLRAVQDDPDPQIPGAAKTYLMFTACRKGQRWTGRNMPIGRKLAQSYGPRVPARRSCARALADRATGFTMLEMMIVIAIMVILLGMAAGNYIHSVQKAQGSHAAPGFAVMRDAIQQYTLDKEAAPQSLDDLVTAGYMREIPTDPMTQTQGLADANGRSAAQSRSNHHRRHRCAQQLEHGFAV